MKRDIDVIRELMLKLESLPMEYGDNAHIAPDSPGVLVDGYSFDQIAGHLDLIVQAGFIDRSRSHPAIGFMFRGLSWSGYDFLDSVRSPPTCGIGPSRLHQLRAVSRSSCSCLLRRRTSKARSRR
jgi:hypothetical protein